MSVEDKKDQLKRNFQKMDQNGDGVLNFNEFSNLLRQGNNRLNDRELRKIFNAVAGGDGKVDFNEFVDYCYSSQKREAHTANRTTAGRHERLSASGAISTDTDDDGLWGPIRDIYESFLGKDQRFEGRDFMKLCTDCKLFDSKFSKADVDLAFAKYKVKGQNTILFENFQNCVREIARKKGKRTSEVQQQIVDKASSGPSKTGTTQAEYVKFYDDKSQFTGQHAHNENFGHAGHSEQAPGARHDRLRQAESFGDHDAADEADWDALKESFEAFCNGLDGEGDNLLDSREFNQMMADCNLFVKEKFTTADADIIFTKVKAKGERRIDFEQFKDACVGIAKKRGCRVSDVQAMIAEVHGPKGRGTTEAKYNRFHDDKTTYTGMHAY